VDTRRQEIWNLALNDEDEHGDIPRPSPNLLAPQSTQSPRILTLILNQSFHKHGDSLETVGEGFRKKDYRFFLVFFLFFGCLGILFHGFPGRDKLQRAIAWSTSSETCQRLLAGHLATQRGSSHMRDLALDWVMLEKDEPKLHTLVPVHISAESVPYEAGIFKAASHFCFVLFGSLGKSRNWTVCVVLLGARGTGAFCALGLAVVLSILLVSSG
jgi:hypothetical protein